MKVIEINHEKGRRWTEEWLSAGHFVSEAVLAKVSFTHGQFRTCITDEAATKPLPDFATGWVASRKEVDAWLARVLDVLTPAGARCIIVEDDLSRPTDPAFKRSDIPSALMGDRVLCWHDLHPASGATAVNHTRYIGSGYPRNAFVVSSSARELGLADRQQVPQGFLSRVTESLMAVIVAIFDDESYLVWTPGDSNNGKSIA
jgi:hypothetical protein